MLRSYGSPTILTLPSQNKKGKPVFYQITPVAKLDPISITYAL